MKKFKTVAKRSIAALLTLCMIMCMQTTGFAQEFASGQSQTLASMEQNVIPASMNAIVNGDFETGDTSGWTISDPDNRTSVVLNTDAVNTSNVFNITAKEDTDSVTGDAISATGEAISVSGEALTTHIKMETTVMNAAAGTWVAAVDANGLGEDSGLILTVSAVSGSAIASTPIVTAGGSDSWNTITTNEFVVTDDLIGSDLTLVVEGDVPYTYNGKLDNFKIVSREITNIKFNTEVNPDGDYPVNFELTLSDPATAAAVRPEDFTVTGQYKDWLGKLNDFNEAKGNAVPVTNVILNDNVLTLTLGAFPERTYNLSDYSVSCTNPAFAFTKADVDQVVTPGMEKFNYVVSDIDSKQFNYYLYTPSNADAGPQPLVLFNHGMSDRWALQANRYAITFAEEHNQSRHPSYILAPQYEDVITGSSNNARINADFVNDEAAKLIQKLIDEGKVDPNRIYVVGKSMGGANSYRTLDRHNNMFAAGLITCAINYTFTNGTSTDQLMNTPVWIFYSEGDSGSIVTNNRNIYSGLAAANAFMAKRTELSVEQVDARKKDANHATELHVTESDRYLDWLYAQTKTPVADQIINAKAYANVTADGQVINKIELLAKEGANLSNLSFTINGAPVTTAVNGNVITLSGLSLDAKSNFSVAGPAGFSFDQSDLRDVITDTVDDFLEYSAGMSNGYNYDHSLYVPAITPGDTVGARETRPLIVVLSKAEDNLRDNRNVIAWAEQTEKPAYVLAPSAASGDVIGEALKSIEYFKSVNLIDDVYVTGDDAAAVSAFLAAYPSVKASSTFTDSEFAQSEKQIIADLFLSKNITNIKFNTEVNPDGDYPVNFELTLSDPASAATVKPEDFIITGQYKDWLSKLNDFNEEKGNAVHVTDVKLNGNVLTLTVGAFPERTYNLTDYTVSCTNDAFSFTMADVDQVVTPGMEKFNYVVSDIDSKQFNYYLHTPSNADQGPQPLVLFNHGMSDRWALQANRYAITFAEEHNQSKHPSYILAPQYEDVITGSSNNARINANFVNDEAVKLIQKLIDEGKVDPNRIYVVGKSMGGANSYRTLDRHNDMFAAGLITCAINYTFTNGTSTDQLMNTPVWIFYSEGDSGSIVTNNRNIYSGLAAANAFMAKRTELSVEQVDARKKDANHATELHVTESDRYLDWLYAQTKAPVADQLVYAKAYANVTANGQVINKIELLAKEGANLSNLNFTINGTPVTTAVNGNVITLSGLSVDAKSDFSVAGPAGFSFDQSDLRDIITGTVDSFLEYTAGMSNGYNYDHSLYVPAITPGDTVGARETRPLVVVLSKAEDNLRDNRNVIAWAEQKVKPAYVLAPSTASADAIENTLKSIEYFKSVNLIDDVYVTGDDTAAVNAFLAAYPSVKASSTFTAGEFAQSEKHLVAKLFRSEGITNIKLNTEVNPDGDYPVNFELTLSNPASAAAVKPEDFTVTGQFKDWLGKVNDFNAEKGNAVHVTDVKLNGNVLTLTVGTFPERSYNLTDYTVSCTNPAFSFTMADVDQVVTPGMEKFNYVVSDIDSKQFNYYLYTPSNADEGPQPLVLFNHGASDRWALQANRYAITFAEEHNQSRHPSYILAPQYEDVITGSSNNARINANFVNDEAAKLIQKLIDEGKVDPDRIYVVGKSMGGANSYRTLDRHNDMFAAGLITCAINYTFTNGTSTDQLMNIPLWIFYSEGDSGSIVTNNRNIFSGLAAANAFMAKRTELSVEQVDARKKDANHATELHVTESDRYIDWLYAQTKAPVADQLVYAKAYASVKADGQLISRIELLAKEGANLSNLSFTINGAPVTTAVNGNVITLSGLSLDAKSKFSVSGPAGFSFDQSDLRDIITGTVDSFLEYSAGMSNGYNYDHSFYVPAITPGNTVGARETRPLIVVLSKAEDNLRDNRNVVAWANQTIKPAYVLAPSMASADAIKNTLKSIEYFKSVNLIDEVYVTGDDAAAVNAFVAAYPTVKKSTIFTDSQMALSEQGIIEGLLGSGNTGTTPDTPGNGGGPAAPTQAPGETEIPVKDNQAPATISSEASDGNLKVAVSIPADKALEMLKQAAAEKKEVIIPIATEDIISQIKQAEVSSVNVDVTLSSDVLNNENIDYVNIKLESELLKAAAESGKDVKISVKDENGKEQYTWSFTGDDLKNRKNAVSDVNLSLSVAGISEDQKLNTLINGKSDADNSGNLIVRFNNEGSLPAQASVRIYVGDIIKNDNEVYVYHYNEAAGMLETLPFGFSYAVDAEGYITVNLIHCSDYAVLQEEAKGSVVNTLREQISITPKTKTLHVGGADNTTTDIVVKLPETLQLVASMKDKTLSSAVGAVTVAFKSSDNKIATVDSNGKVKAVGTGTATITATVTLYSKKTITFKTTIKVVK